MSNYIPRLANIAETCEWLAAETGEQWTLPRLLEAALQPWVWLDYSPEHPAIFGDRHEGFLAPFVFMSDTFRLEADRQSALMTMTRTPDDNLLKIAPGLRIALDELRFKREDVTQLAADLRAPAPAAPTEQAANRPDYDAELAALFDPVRRATLEALFPDGGKWEMHTERAARNGLIDARAGHGKFNPYRAARWWMDTQAPPGWKWERCARVLANNLPPRSRDCGHLLTGDLD